MSKFIKDLVSKHYSGRLDGVDDALLVNVVGLDANKTVTLRKQLREKEIQLLVVKNSLARRATEGTALSLAFEGVAGTVALIWGGEDLISLAKEVVNLHKDVDFEQFQARGGVMDGEPLSADRVVEISKWPSRSEQLSILSGQILSVGATLSAQLIGPGSALANQIKQKADDGDEPESGDAEATDTNQTTDVADTTDSTDDAAKSGPDAASPADEGT